MSAKAKEEMANFQRQELLSKNIPGGIPKKI